MRIKDLKYQKFYNPEKLNCKFICGDVKADKLETFVGRDITLKDGTEAVVVIPEEDKDKDENSMRAMCLVDSEKFFEHFIPEEDPDYVFDKTYHLDYILDTLKVDNTNEDTIKESRTRRNKILHYLYNNEEFSDFVTDTSTGDIILNRHNLYFSDGGTIKSMASNIYFCFEGNESELVQL